MIVAEQRVYIRDHRPTGLSTAEGCRLMNLPRSTYHQPSASPPDDVDVVAMIVAITDEFELYGYRRVTAELRARGRIVNAKKIADGFDWVADLDREKFFDQVDHDILMGLAARRVSDRRILRLIRGSSPTQAGEARRQRDRHIQLIAEKGRMAWQRTTGYGRRSLVETTIGRYKALVGPQLRARTLAGQQGEVAVAVEVLNRMIRTTKPISARGA